MSLNFIGSFNQKGYGFIIFHYLDLSSDGGIDVLISSKYVGETGKAYGLDMTDKILELANQNKEK